MLMCVFFAGFVCGFAAAVGYGAWLNWRHPEDE